MHLLPTAWALAFGRGVGRLAYVFASAPRRLAIEQAGQALELAPAEAERVAREMFAHLGMLGVELMLADRLRADLESRVDFPEPMQARLRDVLSEGRGVVAVTAHLGNWELMAQRIALAGFDLATAARKNPNPYVGSWLVDTRRAGHVETLERGGSPKGLLSVLRRGGILAFLIDQDTKVPSVFVPFFGRAAKTPSTAARLAIRKRLPVYTSFTFRDGDRHRLELRELSYDDLEGSEDERILALTARMTEHIEAAIRRAPAEWVWVHRRWKSADMVR